MSAGKRRWRTFDCGYCGVPLRARITEPTVSCTRRYQRRCPLCRGFTVLENSFIVLNDAQAEALFRKMGLPLPEEAVAGGGQ